MTVWSMVAFQFFRLKSIYPMPFKDSTSRLFQSLSPEKREKIFTAAAEEFAEHGYRKASVNSIVKTAGISKGSLFQYFSTKRNLFDGLVDLASDQVKIYLRSVREETRELGFFDRLARLIRSGFEFIDNRPALSRIYFHLLQSGDSPFGLERIVDLRRRGESFLFELLLEAQGNGELRKDLDIEKLAFILNSVLENLLRSYYLDHLSAGHGLYRGDRMTLDEWIRTTVDFVRNGLDAPK